ncbi:DUF2345 domain-containing protein, partial [Duganella sp.]|uniref:DUF2345 domain-containing protein n=1 Tax=Duganella sp. TaxID=1904440 RepID=UPI0031D86E23
NSFEAIAADVIWRPQLPGSDGRSHPKPTARGAQSAIVIGADGLSQPSGADELYCDKLGRVRIRYHWQDNGDATCWVRVAQRSAGGGMGSQFLPRIGQEVLVQFIENDIDRPIIVGALYNGQGEGGIAPTPGAQSSGGEETRFQPAADHAPSAQGNLAGGNSPLWHGASADSAGHRNAAAQWGVRSKEFGGAGYNQLLFDDTDAQGRVQLRSTHAASELTLGHLIHSADNYRGSLRGQGAELRTDAYGAVRAGAGLLISSYKINHSADVREPAGDNAAGIALLKQAVKLGETFSEAAKTHETVALAGHIGAAKANASTLDPKAAPLQAMLTAVSGMVGNASLDAAKADAAEKKTAPGDDQLPHAGAPIIAISGKRGIGVTSGAAVQLANGEAISLMSGNDSQFMVGGQMRAHSGQAIGVLGGAVKAGEGGLGLQLIAAKDAIDIQAQADELKVQARDDINIISANASVDWAAAKRISLSTAGGANITIDGGNITVQCPGKLTVHAGKKNFSSQTQMNYPPPALPRSTIETIPLSFAMRLQDAPGLLSEPYPNSEWRVVRARDIETALGSEELILAGTSDDDGRVVLSKADEEKLHHEYNQTPSFLWVIANSHARQLEINVARDDWSDRDKFYHGLNALGYADDHLVTNGADVEDFHAIVARNDLKSASGASLFDKMKKGT